MAKYERLQGKEWYDLKKSLTNINYETSENGNIKGFYKSKDGTIYTHWLSDEEKMWVELKKWIQEEYDKELKDKMYSSIICTVYQNVMIKIKELEEKNNV